GAGEDLWRRGHHRAGWQRQPRLPGVGADTVGGVMSSIRVLLVDDQALVRQGFRMILDAEPDIEVVGEASDGEQAVASAARFSPDVDSLLRSEEHTSELQSQSNLVCRLLLEKKKSEKKPETWR